MLKKLELDIGKKVEAFAEDVELLQDRPQVPVLIMKEDKFCNPRERCGSSLYCNTCAYLLKEGTKKLIVGILRDSHNSFIHKMVEWW